MHEKLIARLEKLDGPDREVDALLKAARHGGVAMLSPFNGEWCIYRAGTKNPGKGRLLERPRSVSHTEWSNDRYTASIDAALTLVPEKDRLTTLMAAIFFAQQDDATPAQLPKYIVIAALKAATEKE